MTRVLITLGDSWPEGAELGSGSRYGELLQQTMNYDEFYNYGTGGASNEDMLYQLQHYIADHHAPHKQVTAIFFLTNPSRTAHFPRCLDWKKFNDQMKDVYMHFHTDKHEVMRSSATVSALQYWCNGLGFDDYYFSGWVRYPTWLPGVDTGKIWKQGQETVADWFGAYDDEHLTNSNNNLERIKDVIDESNVYIRPNLAHPNQLGHDLIATRLQAWINKQ